MGEGGRRCTEERIPRKTLAVLGNRAPPVSGNEKSELSVVQALGVAIGMQLINRSLSLLRLSVRLYSLISAR